MIDLAEQIHTGNVAKGFWPDGGRNMNEAMMLVVSELSEALEAHRAGKSADPDHVTWAIETLDLDMFTAFIRGSWQEELADVAIRCLDIIGHNPGLVSGQKAALRYFPVENFGENLLYICRLLCVPVEYPQRCWDALCAVEIICTQAGVPLRGLVLLKLKYNETRPVKHGKKY